MFSAGSPENEERNNVVPEYGYYIRTAYILTRSASWFSLMGSEIYGPLATGVSYSLTGRGDLQFMMRGVMA
jgi:hypothetical protein